LASDTRALAYADSVDVPGPAVETDEDDKGSDAQAARKRGGRKKLNLLSVVALILALVGSPLALIFGYIAAGQVRRSDQVGGVLAWIAVGLGWLWTVALVVVLASFGIIWWEDPLWP
jgi:hypothetical protein